MVITDFKKLPEQIIVDLINYENDTNLLPEFLSFGKPVITNGIHNTSLVTTAIPGSHYSGSVTLKYNRADLSTMPGLRDISFAIGSATRISDLIPEINRRFHIHLTPNDYLDRLLPDLRNGILGQMMEFDLVAGLDSLVFINKIRLNVIKTGVSLSSVITKQVLGGLMYTPHRHCYV